MSDDPDAAYGAISEVAARSLGATVARVWVNDPDAGVLRAAGSFGVQADVEAELLDVRTLRHGAGLPGRVLGTRTPEFIRDAHDDPRWLNGRYIRALDLHAYAGLPLISGGVVTGVLSLMFAGPREFSAQERALAGTLADATAVTVRMDRLHEQRRRGDVQDAVARLANTLGHELNNPPHGRHRPSRPARGHGRLRDDQAGRAREERRRPARRRRAPAAAHHAARGVPPHLGRPAADVRHLVHRPRLSPRPRPPAGPGAVSDRPAR
jgi:hypothetical protein